MYKSMYVYESAHAMKAYADLRMLALLHGRKNPGAGLTRDNACHILYMYISPVTAYTNLVYIVVESFSVPHVGTLGQCNITIKRL